MGWEIAVPCLSAGETMQRPVMPQKPWCGMLARHGRQQFIRLGNGLGTAIARRQRGGASLRRSQGAQSGILILLLVMSWASKADFIRAYSPVAVSVRAAAPAAACRMLSVVCRLYCRVPHAGLGASQFTRRYVACCMLRDACCMLRDACCMVHVACSRSSWACCMLHVACCTLHAEQLCMLHVAGGAAVHADVDRQPRRGPGQILQGSDGT